MKTVTLLLLVLLFSSGCIVTYRDFPIARSLPRTDGTATLPRCHQTVQFSYGQAEGGTYQWTYNGMFSPMGMVPALEDALQHYAGCSSNRTSVYPSQQPGTEVVVSVQEKPYPWHWYGEYLGWISSKVCPSFLHSGRGLGVFLQRHSSECASKDLHIRNYGETILLAVVVTILMD